MINNQIIQSTYIIFAIIITILYTLFAPEAFFHHTDKKDNPSLFDRWNDKRLAWNIHQSFIHLLGAIIGFTSIFILIFKLGVDNPNQYSITHLILLLIGSAGIMGFLPRILFGSSISK